MRHLGPNDQQLSCTLQGQENTRRRRSLLTPTIPSEEPAALVNSVIMPEGTDGVTDGQPVNHPPLNPDPPLDRARVRGS